MRSFAPQGVSPYPHAEPLGTRDSESQFDADYLHRLAKQMQSSLDDIAQYYVDQTNRVDEYRPQSLSGETLTIESWQADYECPEIITGVIVTGPGGSQTGQSQSNSGSQTAPPAGTVITSLALAQGSYVINGENVLAGAAAVVDLTNFGLYVGNTLVDTLSGSNNGVIYGNIAVDIPAGGATLAIKAISNGTAGIVYTSELTATPAATFTLQLGRRTWTLELPATGILVISPIQISMNRDSTRQLTAGTPGNWSVELMGYADTGRRGRV